MDGCRCGPAEENSPLPHPLMPLAATSLTTQIQPLASSSLTSPPAQPYGCPAPFFASSKLWKLNLYSTDASASGVITMNLIPRRRFLRAAGCSLFAAPFARPLLSVAATVPSRDPSRAATRKVTLNARDFGTAVHPDRPIEGFTLSNVTGICTQGISLANMRGGVLRNITVTGLSGPLLRTHNIHGMGL